MTGFLRSGSEGVTVVMVVMGGRDVLGLDFTGKENCQEYQQIINTVLPVIFGGRNFREILERALKFNFCGF